MGSPTWFPDLRLRVPDARLRRRLFFITTSWLCPPRPCASFFFPNADCAETRFATLHVFLPPLSSLSLGVSRTAHRSRPALAFFRQLTHQAGLSPSHLRPSRFAFFVGYSFWLDDRSSSRLDNARALAISPCSRSVRSNTLRRRVSRSLYRPRQHAEAPESYPSSLCVVSGISPSADYPRH
ncbi:hypothetical protein VTG60DRAFT_3688 [Thermothelomyces hinnuleus]